jgi:2-polyprenyl-6-methoxyphenol hydroxylase-like FAD-dependent oxidoreductase
MTALPRCTAPSRYDALIIGGGPAGATSALLLAKAGWSVAIVERAAYPRRKVCGEFISATTLPLLEALGIGDAFRARAGPEVRRVALFGGDEVLVSAMPAVSDGAFGRALGREHLDTMLLDAAERAGATRWQPWSAVALDREHGRFICTIAARDQLATLDARLVVAAHGSWETGRLATQAARPHKDSDLLGFKAHFDGAALASDLMPLIVFPGGYGGMVHTDGGRVTLSCCIRRDVLQQCRARFPGGQAGDAVLHHIESSCGGVRDALAPAQRNGAWLSAGPIRPGLRQVFGDGVFRVGNAAGEAHPVVAEGISMAMQSAWLLAGALTGAGALTPQQDAATIDAVAVARAYRTAWRRQFTRRVRAAAFFAHLAMRPQQARPLLPILRRFPALLTWGARLSGKTCDLAARPSVA